MGMGTYSAEFIGNIIIACDWWLGKRIIDPLPAHERFYEDKPNEDEDEDEEIETTWSEVVF